MTKPIWNIRPEPFLAEAVDHYANEHRLKDTDTGTFNRTEVLHAMVKELLDKARRVSMAEADKESYRLLAEELKRKYGTFRCGILAEDVTGIFCEQCQRGTLNTDCPSDIKACPKAIAFRETNARIHARDKPSASVTSPGVPCDPSGVNM